MEPFQLALERMKATLKLQETDGDVMLTHEHADKILCQLLRDIGQNELVDTYEAIDKWYA